MSIDVEPRDFGKVIQLVAKRDGWNEEETRFNLDRSILITGNPDPILEHQTPDDLLMPLQAAWLTTKERRPNDFNGPKVAVRSLAVKEGYLIIHAVETDYFTLWGLPQAEQSKPLFAEHERQVIVNRAISPDALYETNIPWGVCSHNIFLDKNGDILFMVRSMSQGFNQGRVSATQEEQMEPSDLTPYLTSHRSFVEELGLNIPKKRISLLGIALEKGAAYPAFAFVAESDYLAKDIVGRWRNARDHNEHTALFVVPMTRISRWMGTHELSSEVWQAYLLAGNIAPDAKLRLHNTSAWRLELARKFTQSS